MGSLRATEMAASGLPLDVILRDHLQANHFPPIPVEMVGPCKRAIDRVKRGEGQERVRLPEGITHRVYGRLVPASVLVEQLRLEPFCG